MKFFGAGIGGGGTTWLAGVLSRANGGHCFHHEQISCGAEIHHSFYAPFPIERWNKEPGEYGEVSGALMRHLSPYVKGPELQIPRRFALVRDPWHVTQSWVNRFAATENAEPGMVLSWMAREVLVWTLKLIRWGESHRDQRVFRLEDLSRHAGALQDLVDWLGLDYRVTAKDAERINPTPLAGALWTPRDTDTYLALQGPYKVVLQRFNYWRG